MSKLEPMDIDSVLMEYTYRMTQEDAPLVTPDFIKNSHRQYAMHQLSRLEAWAKPRIIPNLLVEKDDWNGGYNRAIRDLQQQLSVMLQANDL